MDARKIAQCKGQTVYLDENYGLWLGTNRPTSFIVCLLGHELTTVSELVYKHTCNILLVDKVRDALRGSIYA